MPSKRDALEESLGPVTDFMRGFWEVGHASELVSKHMAATHGLTSSQRMILRVVATHPEISAREIARFLHVDAGTLSTSLRRLEERGLLSRQRDGVDGRKIKIVLSPKGKKLAAQGAGDLEAAFSAALAEISPRDAAVAKRVLAKVCESLYAVKDDE